MSKLYSALFSKRLDLYNHSENLFYLFTMFPYIDVSLSEDSSVLRMAYHLRSTTDIKLVRSYISIYSLV